MRLQCYLLFIGIGLIFPNLVLSKEYHNDRVSIIENHSTLHRKDVKKISLSKRKTFINKNQKKYLIPNPLYLATSKNNQTVDKSCTDQPPKLEHPLTNLVNIDENIVVSLIDDSSSLDLKKSKINKLESTSDKEKIIIISNDEINRYPILVKADFFYRCGETLLAEKFYKDAKDSFADEKEIDRDNLAEAVYESEYLSPGGSVYWRLYKESLEDNIIYQSKPLASLQLLSKNHPEFIPGHLKFAEFLNVNNQHEEALDVLKKAMHLYPNEAPLVKAKIKSNEQSKDWLAASLTARQFVIFNQEHFLNEEFRLSADKNLARYQTDLKNKMTWNMLGNAVMNGIGVALMGNILAPLSTIQTSYLLLQGESTIGESYMEGFKNRFTLVEDQEINLYINQIGDKLAKVAGRDEFKYEFFVVMDKNINAFALPGGKVFINLGAIAKTSSEAEIAGLLAHELAHSVLSHGFQQMTRGALVSSVVDYIPYIGGLASNLTVLAHSRSMEEQADLFGTRLLAATGFAADGVRNLMVTMNSEHKNSPPAWLSTHPDPNSRIKYIEKEIIHKNLNRFAYEGVEKHQRIRKKVVKLLQNDEIN